MGLFIPIQHTPPSQPRLSEPTQRVCAWCGVVEPAGNPLGTTTHGLCRECLEKRTRDPESERDGWEQEDDPCES